MVSPRYALLLLRMHLLLLLQLGVTVHKLAADQAEIRELSIDRMEVPISQADFETALAKVQSSVSEADIAKHVAWKAEFGAS